MACDAPLSIRYNPPMEDGKGGYIYYFPADCGKCLKCLSKRKAQWSFRLTEEKRASFSAYFITLTYTDEHLPWGDGVPSINKNDHTEFINKLKFLESPKELKKRKAISIEELRRKENGIQEKGELKYYGVYEYGDQFGRPHAHYLLFNVRDINNIDLAWCKGKIDVDPDVNVNNIDYVLKYMVKQHEPTKYEKKQKEVQFHSKGLGLCAADDQFINHIQKLEANQVVNQRGVKLPLPRYYRKKFLEQGIRLKKNQYIAEQIEEKKRDMEKRILPETLSKMELSAINSRLNALKSRTKRGDL